jgi:hypothetical protein
MTTEIYAAIATPIVVFSGIFISYQLDKRKDKKKVK